MHIRIPICHDARSGARASIGGRLQTNAPRLLGINLESLVPKMIVTVISKVLSDPSKLSPMENRCMCYMNNRSCGLIVAINGQCQHGGHGHAFWPWKRPGLLGQTSQKP